MKIASISVALVKDGDTTIKALVAVDDNGRAWEFVAQKWRPLPELPQCAGCQTQSDALNCPYHKAVAGR